MIKLVYDQAKLDAWSSACVLLEMVMGHSWFDSHWLETFREKYTELRQLSTTLNQDLQQRLRGFCDVLRQHTMTAIGSIQNTTIQVLLRMALEIQAAERANVHSMLSVCGPTEPAAPVRS